MKQRIKIIKDDKVLFQGRIADIPIKQTFIIKKSVELFDDEDPCIIHQSYVVKEYVDILLGIFKSTGTKEIKASMHMDQLEFLDFHEAQKLTIILEG